MNYKMKQTDIKSEHRVKGKNLVEISFAGRLISLP